LGGRHLPALGCAEIDRAGDQMIGEVGAGQEILFRLLKESDLLRQVNPEVKQCG
jgi:hypothetical protein